MSEKTERFLGIDTSNYTTSVGVLSSDGSVMNLKKLLPVADGARGLRQSDAVFAHVKQFEEVFSQALTDGVRAVGVSVSPRNAQGSYMPCFLAGKTVASSVAHALGVPLYSFSHQQGHIAAGLFSAGRTEWLSSPFTAFHLSGGTLELVLVKGLDDITVIGKTLDLTAGQLIDRVGVAVGCPFPAGASLDRLSEGQAMPQKPHICLKGFDCCLSGFENQAYDLLKKGVPAGEVAVFLFEAVARTVCAMLDAARREFGHLPCLLVGGVMSNRYIKKALSAYENTALAAPELSSDNAVGTAWLTRYAFENGGCL